MKTTVYTIENKKKGSIELPEELFASTVASQVLAQYLRVYQHSQRQATKKAQSRGEVTGTTAKVWRQKGTGRARHGSRKAPIFVGGGKAHGPTGQENYKLNFSKRMRRQALSAALTAQLANTIVVAGLDQVESKTKSLQVVLDTLVSGDKKQKITVILDQPLTNITQASNNLAGVTTTQAARLNAFEIINSDKIILAESAVKILTDTFVTKSTTSAKPTATTKSKA